ncbi:MSMEG_4193 family putative phosphomutase [Propionicicella superfundia]|uniref:MSMEG_4193 family putative phosphomutase n=1 Tax=Propionicicella superfundia TaxID=348582 RepID=UPI00040AF514|nr:MSMEG_4193 family putative phosphomutase [Propionicicella superfundia]
MPTLLLVRHGRSDANTAGILAGRAPGVHLDDTGRAQATDLAGRLDGVRPSVVVVSPLERCRETADLAFPGVRAVVDDRLGECDYGDWTGRRLAELKDEALWAEIQSRPTTVAFPGGEAMSALFARVTAVVEDWSARVAAEFGPWAAWAAVSHADPIKAAVAGAIGLPLDRFQALIVNPASVSVLHRGADRWALVSLNGLAGPVAPLVPQAPPAEPGGGAGVGAAATT